MVPYLEQRPDGICSQHGVVKTAADAILAHCMICQTEEVFIQNWQKTEWAEGMMKPVPVNLSGPPMH